MFETKRQQVHTLQEGLPFGEVLGPHKIDDAGVSSVPVLILAPGSCVFNGSRRKVLMADFTSVDIRLCFSSDFLPWPGAPL